MKTFFVLLFLCQYFIKVLRKTRNSFSCRWPSPTYLWLLAFSGHGRIHASSSRFHWGRRNLFLFRMRPYLLPIGSIPLKSFSKLIIGTQSRLQKCRRRTIHSNKRNLGEFFPSENVFQSLSDQNTKLDLLSRLHIFLFLNLNIRIT